MLRISLAAQLSLALCCVPPAYGQTLKWTRQLGTSRDDMCKGVSADGLGNVYITGGTWGRLEGAGAGDRDAFVTKVGIDVPETDVAIR